MKWITEYDRDNVCDIAWWIKGYIAGAKENYENCPFTEDHLRTLSNIASGMRESLNNSNSDGNT